MLRFIFGIIFFTVILYSVILGSVSGFCELLNNWEGAHIKPKTIFRISIILLILSLVFFFGSQMGYLCHFLVNILILIHIIINPNLLSII